MLSHEIRKKFINYFKEQKHAVVPSSATVPHDDPTLLFNNAGMNQFKDVFLGKSNRDYTRAVSSQKCIRVGGKHNDLDNVGHTSRHLTFFEMLGNFSFGDYFKKEAIQFAWEVSTEIFQLDPDKIWITVYETDEEAYELWKPYVHPSKITRFGESENFWAMGDVGPCGPCSELYYDRGESYGSMPTLKDDPEGHRYIEFWNLVFMQYNRESNGELLSLPKKSIDTGAGLERVISLIQKVPSVFQTDILSALIAEVETITNVKYNPKDLHLAPAFHVIADHIRSLSFAIADGVQPSNTDRGYVLRKILRRAVRYGRLLGVKDPFLAKVFPRLIEMMGDDYHELKTARNLIEEILTVEEENFIRTLKRGGNILQTIIEKASKTENKEITGMDAFKLKDTYGFPLEEILLIAKDSDLHVNLDAYQLLEEQAKELSRQMKETHVQTVETTIFEDFIAHHGTSEFVGYEETAREASIIGIIVNGKLVESMERGQSGMIILDKTPFYPEKGGQIGDKGVLTHHQAHFTVIDCKVPYNGVIAHIGTLDHGILLLGEPIQAVVDLARRENIAKHHTATHLLHWALQEVLGPHIRQAGSLVEADRLRFDFSHHKGLTKEELRKVEALVNEKIWENKPLKTYELPFDEVQKHPEIKQFFGEKYGSKVRVVDIDNYSRELCGGTHIDNVGRIGYFRIAKEGSIAQGVRRIEGVIGKEAEKIRYHTEDQMEHIASTLSTTIPKVGETLLHLVKESEELRGELLQKRKKELHTIAANLLMKVKKTGRVPTLCSMVDVHKNELSDLGADLLNRMGSGVVLLCLIEGDKCQLLLKVSSDLVATGIHANTLLQSIHSDIEGSGGGKKESAQAGGKNPKGIVTAFEKIDTLLKEK